MYFVPSVKGQEEYRVEYPKATLELDSETAVNVDIQNVYVFNKSDDDNEMCARKFVGIVIHDNINIFIFENGECLTSENIPEHIMKTLKNISAIISAC